MQGQILTRRRCGVISGLRIANRSAPQKNGGYGLVETMTVVGIMSILLGVAVPSFQGLQARHRLEGHAMELVTNIYYVRSEAVARNSNLRISFGTDTGGTCYVLHTGNEGDCNCSSSGSATCNDLNNTMIKNVGFASDQGVRLQANVESMLFEPARGTTTPAGTINLIDNSGKTIRQVINIMGRVRSCSPQGSVNGYKVC